MKKDVMRWRKYLLFVFFVLMTVLIIVLSTKAIRKSFNKTEKKNRLWTHIVYTEINPTNGGRRTVMSHGLFNQLFSLFNAVDFALILDRDLVVSNFYVSYMDTTNSVPLSKIINTSTTLVPTSDWNEHTSPTPSIIAQHTYNIPPESIEILFNEKHTPDLEIGCLFNCILPNHSRDRHIQNLKFHPIFYEIVSSLTDKYPHYQVVHYRMEDDFAGYYYQQSNFSNPHDFKTHFFKQYINAFKSKMDPEIPTLVVSHYYKDPHQSKDFDLPWKNIIHFTITEQDREKLCRHLGLPVSTPMREVDAIIDYVLCTTDGVRHFIGCEMSAFSEAVVSFRKKKDCFLVKPKNS